MTNDVKQSLTSAETRSTGLVDYFLSREKEIIDDDMSIQHVFPSSSLFKIN